MLLDTSDQQNALGYHNLTSTGLPIAKVFVKSDMDAGASWSITISHELIEMLGDSAINLTVFVQSSNTKGRLLSYELCDAPESDQYGYDINGVKVSDFVYPRWFGIPGSTTKFDHMDHIKHELEILPGGYIGEFDVTGGTGWKQTTSEISLHAHREIPKEGSRRERRSRGKDNWKLSTAHKC